MIKPEYFSLSYNLIRNAKQEKLDDSHAKYILDDGTYILASKTQDWYSSFDRYTKYEKDASQKVYDSHFDLIKIINADGTVLAELEYSHGPYPEAIRNYHSIYDTVNKKRYYVDGHYDNSYFIKDAYFCVEKEFENGCKRSRMRIKDAESDFFKKPEDCELSAEGNFIREVYADGTERFYKVENCEMVDKFMESGWDEAKQYRQMFPLIYENLQNGTKRKYENGYIKVEEIPNLVKRVWLNGALRYENFERFDVCEHVRYRDEDITVETRKDGTVCTFYQGKLVSETRPNGSHNTVTSRVDDNGVVRAFFPNGQPMFIYDGGRYQQWAENGRVKQKCSCVKCAAESDKQELSPSDSPLTYYYDTSTEENKCLAAEGWGFVFVDGNFKDLKKHFDESMAKQDIGQAVKNLKWICLSADKVFETSRQDYRAYDGISMMARNCLNSRQIKVLENGLVAFGAIFEDRYFVKQSFIGGIEWYWRAAGVLLDLENGGIIAKCATPRINVRDKYDPNKDKWKHIDTHNFMDVKDGKLTVRLGSYESASCDIDTEKYNQFLKTVRAESQIKQTMQQINDYLRASIGR